MSSALDMHAVHLRHRGGDHDVVRDLSLSIRPGEILVLIGPNGSGKSTALAALGRTLTPRTGRIRLDGADVQRWPTARFARVVARLPQRPTAPEGVTVAALVRHGRHAHRGPFAAPTTTDRAAFHRAVHALDVADLSSRRLDRLSGGEQCRAWLAMVLSQEAPIVLLDEPTAALDLRHQIEVLQTLRRLRDEHGVGLVVVLHDLEHAARIADRIAVLHRGRLYAVGRPRECLTADMLRDVYGVAARVQWDADGCSVRVHATMAPQRSL